MKDKQSYSRGVAAVGFMALSKRAFFQRLLEAPADALAGVREELELTDDDVADVTAIVHASLAECPTGRGKEQLLSHWDQWRASGLWGGGRGGWISIGGWPCL